MTGRERMQAVLHRQKRDRLSWTTIIDATSLTQFPEPFRDADGIDFCRAMGCDVFLLNGWGTGIGFRSPQLRWPGGVRTQRADRGERRVQEWRTPRGTLTSVTHRGHPVKYPVDSLDALRVYREMWEGAVFAELDDREALAELDARVGDAGVVTRFWGPSTIPRLLENDMGVENFYYLLHDHPDEMDALITLMHERELAAFQCLAGGPWDPVTLCENTSTHYISPAVYRKYNMPHQRDFVRMCHAAGTAALLHMCGHVRDILTDIRETGCDGIHALTPPPTGNTPWEEALDVLGEDCILIGILDPTIFILGPKERIAPALDALMTPRIRRSNFVLCPAADGIVVPLERFQAVAEWFRQNGDL